MVTLSGNLARDVADHTAALLAQYGPIVTRTAPDVVANLPPAAQSAGCRAFVTDATVVASGNFATVVAGGSTHAVPVFCDGTNWLIG